MLAGTHLRRPPVVDPATRTNVRWFGHAIGNTANDAAPDAEHRRAALAPRRASRAVASVRSRAGPRVAAPRRGPAHGARPVAAGVRDAADPGRVARSAAADGPARRGARAVEERRDAPDRPARR